VVTQRTPCGKRNYVILVLLATYGLRAREIAAMTLDHIAWKRGRLAIPERKAATQPRSQMAAACRDQRARPGSHTLRHSGAPPSLG
jgi:integrase